MSYNNKKDRIEERVYSVTMTEEELKLFSEFLEQRTFNDDYQQEALSRAYDVVDRHYQDEVNDTVNKKLAQKAIKYAIAIPAYYGIRHIVKKKKERDLAKERYKTSDSVEDKKKENK